METTICPWCHTEIVWDEEIGPEEECPHCHNELKGYRTLNVTLSDDEEELDEALKDEFDEGDDYDSWMDEEEPGTGSRSKLLSQLPSLSGGDTDLLAYESAIGKILEVQDQMPECPHCREYMIHTGESLVKADSFQAAVPQGFKHAFLEAPFRMNVYVCPSCFHVGSFLADEGRIRFANQIQKAAETE